MKHIFYITLFMLFSIGLSAQVNPKILKADSAQQILWSIDLDGTDTYWGFRPFLLNSILTDTLGWVGTDNQAISIDSNATTYTASLVNGGSIQWTKASGSTDDQAISIDSNATTYTATLEDGGQIQWAKNVGTDDQTLLIDSTASSYGFTVEGDTRKTILKSVNTDAQTLSFSNPNLSITNGNSVNISGIDTDNQTIDVFSFSNPTLSLSLQDDGEATKTVNLSALSDGDGIYDGSGTVGGTHTVTIGAGNKLAFDVTGTTGEGNWGSVDFEINGVDAMTYNAASEDFSFDGGKFIVDTDADEVEINSAVRLNTALGSEGDVAAVNSSGNIYWSRSATPFAQYNTTVQQIINTSGTGEKVIDFTEEYDPSTFYSFNGTTDVITPGSAGYYEISIGFEASNSSGTPSASVSICSSGGTPYESVLLDGTAGADNHWVELTHVQYWSSSPAFTIYASNGGSGAWNLGYAKVIVKRISN